MCWEIELYKWTLIINFSLIRTAFWTLIQLLYSEGGGRKCLRYIGTDLSAYEAPYIRRIYISLIDFEYAYINVPLQ
jgi:hypothetical protein